MRTFNTDYVYVFTKKKYERCRKIASWDSINPNKLNGRKVNICNRMVGEVDYYRVSVYWCKAIRRIK